MEMLTFRLHHERRSWQNVPEILGQAIVGGGITWRVATALPEHQGRRIRSLRREGQSHQLWQGCAVTSKESTPVQFSVNIRVWLINFRNFSFQAKGKLELQAYLPFVLWCTPSLGHMAE